MTFDQKSEASESTMQISEVRTLQAKRTASAKVCYVPSIGGRPMGPHALEYYVAD